jgi:dihydroflavonol-4-reductase
MKNVFVTGGTGCLGSTLALALLNEGSQVRILRRQNSDLRAIGDADVEHCIGDVRDPVSLQRAVKGCDTVFHTAAVISYWNKDREEMMDVNVGGTRNLVDACLQAGVEKFVHTSSVAAVGTRADGSPADEETEFHWDASTPAYRVSKHLAEHEVQRGVRHGLPAVIVNPSIIIGPRDLRMHGGQIIRDVKKKRIFYATRGGINVVYVDDVARGQILAASRGRIGERYILAGENVTMRDAFEMTADVVGGIKPMFTLPNGMVGAIASVVEMVVIFFGVRPWITRDLVKTVGANLWFSTEKARFELGYTAIPFREAVTRTYQWYRQHGFL